MPPSDILTRPPQTADHTHRPVPLSRRVQSIKMSPTIAMNERAALLRKGGRDVISLSVGELDFNTPEPIIEAAHAAAQRGFTRYTAADGAPLVKDAVRLKLQRDNGLSYRNEEVHVASGAKQVIFNALMARLDPGDEVIIFSPYWVSYPDAVSFCGGVPVIVETRLENGFLPDPKTLQSAITDRTRMVFINSPNNPTGAVYPASLLKVLAEVLEPYPDIVILSDEIYEHLLFGGARHGSIVAMAPWLRERALIVNGVSKSYAMTGWRIGFAAGPEWLIEAMSRVQSQTSSNASSISQAAAAEAMTGDQHLVPAWRAILEKRREIAAAELARSLRLKTFLPEGAFYLFIDASRCIGAATPSGSVLTTDGDVAEYLLEAAHVAVVPGEAFGASPYLRLSFAVDESRLVEACRRIVAACAELTDRRGPVL